MANETTLGSILAETEISIETYKTRDKYVPDWLIEKKYYLQNLLSSSNTIGGFGATENTLIEVRDRLSSLFGNTDSLESLINTLPRYTNSIDDRISSSNVTATTIASYVASLEAINTVVLDRLPFCDTATTTAIAASTNSDIILAANFSRKGATFYNDSTSILYLKLGTGAASNSFTTKLMQDDYYELPSGYVGVVSAVWDTASGTLYVTELGNAANAI